jgi:signal transduction histidine kinase
VFQSCNLEGYGTCRFSSPPGAIELEIKDHGRGLPEEIRSKIASGVSAGVGFRGMQERVTQVGGALMVQSNGNGTSVVVELPIAEEPSRKTYIERTASSGL